MSEQSQINLAKAPILAFGEKNWDALKQTISEDCVYEEFATRMHMKGSDNIVTCWKTWATALPDSKATIERAHVCGNNTVVLELTWRGTHQGTLQTPLGSIAPTNKPVEVKACEVVEIKDGKVASIRQYFDLTTLLQQLEIGPFAGQLQGAIR